MSNVFTRGAVFTATGVLAGALALAGPASAQLESDTDCWWWDLSSVVEAAYSTDGVGYAVGESDDTDDDWA